MRRRLWRFFYDLLNLLDTRAPTLSFPPLPIPPRGLERMNRHEYVGLAERCLSDGDGDICNKIATHPIHTGVCYHCGWTLEPDKSDGLEVCRFCRVEYAKPTSSCLACQSTAPDLAHGI